MENKSTGVEQSAGFARECAIKMASLSSEVKNEALREMARAITDNISKILSANAKDLKNAKTNGLAEPLIKRLVFDEDKISQTINGINDLTRLADPVGRTTYRNTLDEGLNLYRVTCPMGVIGVIFEARPDSLVQISSLCLKSANAVLLKGGSEAANTNEVLAKIISDATKKQGIPEGWICLLLTRTDVKELLKMERDVDLIIPRGSNQFVRMIMDNTRIPVLGHADGVCHMYIDEKADISMALRVFMDAKTQYAAVCNAVETILVHKDIVQYFLPGFKKITRENEIKVFGCERTCELLQCEKTANWHTEYLNHSVSVKIVDNIDQAIDHINLYGSGHTDAIITNDESNAQIFMSRVDSGNVFWNCSTRFSDGFRYGFGAEVGVSTTKIHARGPVGLEGLMTYKYKLFGTGQIVQDYSSGKSSFLHRQSDKDCPFDR